MTSTIERRYIPATEIRVASDGEPVIEGYAALFNTMSSELRSPSGIFREQIAPGAFDAVLKTADVRALFNHDPNFVLGRTSAGTLSLSTDSRGLKIRNTPPDTQWARDLVVSMRRGDVDQMSFGFKVAPGGQQFERRDGGIVRTITNFGDLLDVSPVTYPAYADTSVAVRSLQEWSEASEDKEAREIVAGIVARSVAFNANRLKLALAR